MATKLDIIDAVHDLLVTTVTEQLDISAEEAVQHVRLSEQTEDAVLPAYTIEVFETPINRGLGSAVETEEVSFDADDATVTFRREKTATVDIGSLVAGDDARRQNKLYTAAEEAFALRTQSAFAPDELDPDVDRIDVRGTQDVSEASDNIRGDRLRVEIEYAQFFSRQFDTIEDIVIDLDVVDDGQTTDY